MKFRNDVLGLRAVAVIPIVLFHAGLDFLHGGFVGVDVFFVISGFLITSTIVRDLKAGDFTLMAFYRKRVARIFPAFLAVMLTTLLIGAAVLLPSELSSLSASAIASLGFVSNFHFYYATDYFGAAAETTPLLHTWSLAVEEQFYIFYPVLVLLVWRLRPQSLKLVVGLTTLLSFGAAFALTYLRPEAAFYLLPARAWELGIGAAVALGLFPSVGSQFLRRALPALGLILIVVAILTVRPGAFFPAPLAALPVIGAAILIAYGGQGFVSSALSLPVMQWVGKISYSLYLWHWPVITIYRIYTGVHLDLLETSLLVAVSTLLAWGTFRWIEAPALRAFRDKRLSNFRVNIGGLVGLGVTAVIAVGISASIDIIRPLPADVRHIAEYLNYRDTLEYTTQFRKGVCFRGEGDLQEVNFDCLRLSTAEPNIIVMGDSHAAQYWRAIEEHLDGTHVVQATASGCRPILNAEGARRCTEIMSFVFKQLAKAETVDGVILAARWNEDEIADVQDTVASLRREGLPVVVIGPMVEYQGDFPVLLARAALTNNEDGLSLLRDEKREQLDSRLHQAVIAAGGKYVSVHNLMCDEKKCDLRSRSKAPFHFDYGHITLDAARDLVAQMNLDALLRK